MVERASAAPAMIRAVSQASLEIDRRDVLTAIRVPTIVVAREGSFQPYAIPEHVADLIPDAEFDWQPEAKPNDGIEGFMSPFIDAVERMVTGGRTPRRTQRILTTVLFTDIVGSTELASMIGDRASRDLHDRHGELLRERVAHAGGRVVKMIGDGSLSLFDEPARAISCAHDFAEAAERSNIGVRAGLHTGECEIVDDDVTGLAVRIGARVSALAGGGGVLVSRTVKDLVVGSGLEFDSRGTHRLKGVTGSWELLALASGRAPTVPVVGEQARVRASDRVVLATARRAPALLRLAGRLARS